MVKKNHEDLEIKIMHRRCLLPRDVQHAPGSFFRPLFVIFHTSLFILHIQYFHYLLPRPIHLQIFLNNLLDFYAKSLEASSDLLAPPRALSHSLFLSQWYNHAPFYLTLIILGIRYYISENCVRFQSSFNL